MYRQDEVLLVPCISEEKNLSPKEDLMEAMAAEEGTSSYVAISS